ncbi:hypothetical protein ABC295_000963 [Vibrio cholerae]
MNGRQFKKLCKRAAEVMIKVEPKLKSQLILSEERGCEPEIGRIYKWDINTLRQNWRWKAGKDKTPDSLPKGIAGFGCWDGYYEPEWDDEDALSVLIGHVIDSFIDWGSCDGESLPKSNCPEELLRLPNKAIKYAELNLIKEAA